MKSLSGFEALLRGRAVTCWGTSPYPGWDLTQDRVACPRRTRRLTIEELAAAALGLYPAHLAPTAGGGGLPCAAEDVLALLA